MLEDRRLLAANLPPENSVPGAQEVTQNVPFAFSDYRGNPISISDPDAGLNKVEVTLTAENGVITLPNFDPSGGLTYSVGDGFEDATMTFTGKITDDETIVASCCPFTLKIKRPVPNGTAPRLRPIHQTHALEVQHRSSLFPNG